MENQPKSIEELLESGVFTQSSREDYGDINVPKPAQPTPKKNISSIPRPVENTAKNFKEDKYSALNLFNYTDNELPKLVDPIFPEVGLASLVGSSDTGKSTLLRQMALSVALGLDNFLGYKVNANTRNVIYISTEDDPASTSISLKKQINTLFAGSEIPTDGLSHLKFIFDFDTSDSDKNIFKILENDAATIGVDLVIIDAFTDVFSGDINSSTRVREFLNWFSKFSKEQKCLVLFLHHTGKRTDRLSASKQNVLGSQAFEAKMRVLLELKHLPNDASKRSLTITKGNYLSSEIKKYSKILKFDEPNLLFIEDGQVLSSSLNSKTSSLKADNLPRIKKLSEEGKSTRDIEEILKKEGVNISKSSISAWLNEDKEK